METSANSILSENRERGTIERLISGERVKCPDCKEGYYAPTCPDAKVCYWYKCDKCGSYFHFDPVVEIP